MKTMIRGGFLLLCSMACMLAACIGTAPVKPMQSPIAADWKAPLNTNLKDLTFGSKVGRATVRCYAYGLLAKGDMSVRTAAASAGITRVHHVDYEYRNIFFFTYQEMTTVVYGD